MNSSACFTRSLLQRSQVMRGNLFKMLVQCSRTVSLCLAPVSNGHHANQQLINSSCQSPSSSDRSQAYHSCPAHSRVPARHSVFDRQLRNVASSATSSWCSVASKGHWASGHCLSSCQYTSSAKTTQSDNNPHTDSHTATKEPQSGSKGDFKLVYRAPLKGAVRAIKIFSLSTATAAVLGGPVLVWMGNQSVPLSGRVIMSSLVMLVGISTTALLHWLVKGYVIQMYFDEQTKTVQLYTLSPFGRKKLHQFNISEAGPPSSAAAFSSFQARGKSYFLHAEVFKDRKILSGLLGAYSEFETTDK